MDALLFNPQTFIQIIERPINKGYNKPDTNKIDKEINKSREQNKTTEYRNNTKHPRDDDIWIRVKNWIKKKICISTQSLKPYESNRYKPLDTIEREDSV